MVTHLLNFSFIHPRYSNRVPPTGVGRAGHQYLSVTLADLNIVATLVYIDLLPHNNQSSFLSNQINRPLWEEAHFATISTLVLLTCLFLFFTYTLFAPFCT